MVIGSEEHYANDSNGYVIGLITTYFLCRMGFSFRVGYSQENGLRLDYF